MAQHRSEDVVTLALISNSLGLIIDNMDSLVVRTSPSAIQRDSHDFSCGIYSTKGEMLCESDRLTHYSNRFSSSIGNWLQTRGIDSLHPGDMFILNDAFSGGSHFNDIFFACPVFVDNQLVAWVSAGGHMLDLGGRVPGSMPADAISCYEEAIRLPFAKVYDRGIRNETFFEVLKANTRISDEVDSHLEPFMAACRMAGNLFSRLAKKFGCKILTENLEELLNYSESRARADIRALPDGVYEFEDYLDDYGPSTGPVRFHLKVVINEDTITYDWTGTAPQVTAPINLPLGDTKGLLYTLFKSLISADIPYNGGEIRPLKLIIPEGTMVNPVIPAPVGQRGVTLGRVYEVILGAQAQIAPDKMPACPSGIDTMLTLGGYDKERGANFIFNHMPTGARGGSSCAGDGELTSPSFLDNRYKSIEVMEELYPIRLNQLALIPDSEGDGKYRGGFGYVVDYEILADETTLSLRTDRQKFAPFGVHGGRTGCLTSITLNPNIENRTLGKTVVTMQDGDVLRVKIAGAGGWGNHLERDVQLVLDDVRDGLVSTRRAKETYGVVIDETTTKVDMNETQKLRELMKKSKM